MAAPEMSMCMSVYVVAKFVCHAVHVLRVCVCVCVCVCACVCVCMCVSQWG